MATVLLALGGNLGNPQYTMRQALDRLNSRPEITVESVSQVYATAAVGEQAGDTFMNAAARLTTTLTPESLLDELQGVEHQLGRVRTVHWGPRNLDLDLIAYNGLVLSTPRLTLPHPGMWVRRFVLDPLCDIAPDWIHPLLGEDCFTLRNRLTKRPLSVCLLTHDPEQIERFQEASMAAFPEGSLVWTTALDAAAIVFAAHGFAAPHLTGLRTPARCVPLPLESPAEFAVEILRAALDGPQSLGPL